VILTMRLKFFDADDQRHAALLVANALGPRAILIGDSSDAHGQFVSIVNDDAEAPAKGGAPTAEAVLHYHDVPNSLAHRILTGRRRRTAERDRLATGLRANLTFARLPPAERTRLMLIGPPAAGKTTLMGKLAVRGGAPVATVLSTDWERPGGLEQLADSMTILGIDVTPLDLDAPAEDLTGPLLIDTAGTEPGTHGDFTKLGRLAQALAVEPVLVLPAYIDAEQAEAFAVAAIAIGAKKLLITRLDMARRLGGPVAAAATGLAIAGASVSPNFAYGLKDLTAEPLTDHLTDLAERHSA
jgi:flagellar biosynthesis protein FlhF